MIAIIQNLLIFLKNAKTKIAIKIVAETKTILVH